MRRGILRVAGFLLLGALLAAPVGADGVTVYVNRSIVSPTGALALGDIVRATGTVSPAQREELARSLAVVTDRILFVPISVYRSQLEELFGSDAIIVGSRSIIVPRGLVPDGELSLLDRLADALQAQGLFPDAVTEMTLTQNSARAVIPADGTPTFQVQTSPRGTTDVSFALAGTTGKLTFVSTRNDTASSVRAGSPVQVIFHKGLITIEMPGKALAAGAAGETVAVLVTDSQKSFTGQVVNGKAVQVDLP
jgi:hypothetical protein